MGPRKEMEGESRLPKAALGAEVKFQPLWKSLEPELCSTQPLRDSLSSHLIYRC